MRRTTAPRGDDLVSSIYLFCGSDIDVLHVLCVQGIDSYGFAGRANSKQMVLVSDLIRVEYTPINDEPVVAD